MIGIYKITSPSKKVYIGQSIDIEKRWKDYKKLRCKAQTKLYNSIKKHGADKHKFDVIIECDESELNEKERYYQDLYSCIGSNGLNCSLTISSDRSGAMSDESKLKMSLAQKGKQKKPCTEKTRKKFSEGKIGIKNPMFGTKGFWFGKKRGSINLGRKHTPEAILKISLASKRKRKPCLEETKNKISRSKLLHGLSDEHKKNIGISMKGKSWSISRRNAQINKKKK